MARRTTTPAPLAWTQLAARTGEMLLASSQVIPIRLARMAAAGPQPSRRDRREFTRMGAEKWQAAGESLFGVAMALQQAQLQAWVRFWQSWWMPWRGGHGDAHFVRVAGAALAPIHRTATANARRLHRVKASRRGPPR